MSWLSTEETKPNTTKANNTKTKWQQDIKSKPEPRPKPTVNCKNCLRVCISLCTTVVHNITQNSSDKFPSYAPDNHHCSDAVH